VRYFVLGAGLAGKEIARVLRAQGHEVVGSTTTPAKVDGLRECFDDVRVLRGADRELIADALRGVDGVVVSAGPPALFDEAEREVAYRAALVETAQSIVGAVLDAGMTGPVVAMSSISVYGSAQNDRDRIEEDGPLTDADLASPRNFRLMERTYLDGLPGQACVFRCVEIYSDGDPPIEEQLTFVQEKLGGRLPFAADALLYRTEVREVADAIAHALTTGMSGVFNLAADEVPESISARCDRVAAAQGWPPFTYAGELENPTKPLSVDRLTAAGFRFATSPA
jgi:nucleoside-diphosphate-sugar epimerase